FTCARGCTRPGVARSTDLGDRAPVGGVVVVAVARPDGSRAGRRRVDGLLAVAAVGVELGCRSETIGVVLDDVHRITATGVSEQVIDTHLVERTAVRDLEATPRHSRFWSASCWTGRDRSRVRVLVAGEEIENTVR